jgi:hypothetical protein
MSPITITPVTPESVERAKAECAAERAVAAAKMADSSTRDRLLFLNMLDKHGLEMVRDWIAVHTGRAA